MSPFTWFLLYSSFSTICNNAETRKWFSRKTFSCYHFPLRFRACFKTPQLAGGKCSLKVWISCDTQYSKNSFSWCSVCEVAQMFWSNAVLFVKPFHCLRGCVLILRLVRNKFIQQTEWFPFCLPLPAEDTKPLLGSVDLSLSVQCSNLKTLYLCHLHSSLHLVLNKVWRIYHFWAV